MTTAMHRARLAFTLVELLVVVAIIALLMSILSPSLKRGLELSRRGVCASNLHHVHTSTAAYADDNDDFVPPRTWAWSQYHVGNDYTTGAPQLAMGFLLLTNADFFSPEMLFCPSDPYFNVHTHWPEGDRGGTRTWLAYVCSYAQREEQVGRNYRMSIVKPYEAYTSDWFTTAIPAWPHAAHADGWEVGYFDGSVGLVPRTDAVWSAITWSSDYTGQAITWENFDRGPR